MPPWMYMIWDVPRCILKVLSGDYNGGGGHYDAYERAVRIRGDIPKLCFLCITSRPGPWAVVNYE